MAGYSKMRINIVDQNGAPVPKSKVKLTDAAGKEQGYPRSTTNKDGNAYFYDVVNGMYFKYIATPPSGYECVTCDNAYVLNSDAWAAYRMNKLDIETYDISVHVTGDDKNSLMNVPVVLDGTLQGYTSRTGRFTINNIAPGNHTVRASRSGYETNNVTFNLKKNYSLNIVLDKSDPFVCNETGKRGYKSCPGQPVGIYTEVCKNNRWVPSGQKCPDVIKEKDERGKITSVSAPTTPQQAGNKLKISCVVKSIGTDPLECRCYLIDAATGDIIDKEPDLRRWIKIKQNKTAKFTFEESWLHGQAIMPDCDLKLLIEAWDVNGDTGKDSHLLATSNTFTIKAETEECVCVDFEPEVEEMYEGGQVGVVVNVKNTGNSPCELVWVLEDADGIIDEHPNMTTLKLAAGHTMSKHVGTKSHPFKSMPDDDWHLTFHLDEITRGSITRTIQKEYFRKDFTVRHIKEKMGKFVSVTPTEKARKGDEVSVVCRVLNDGNRTGEYRVYLLNPEGKTIDKEPDSWKSIKKGREEDIVVSTHWDPLWAMPGRGWDLSVKLYELDTLSKEFIDEKSFTVAFDPTYAEGGEFIGEPTYPEKARFGDEFDVGFEVKNTGTKGSELYVILRDVESGRRINTEPDLIRKLIKPGGTWSDRITTNWHIGAMPEHDWRLMLELYDDDLLNSDDLLDRAPFTVEYVADDDVPPDEVTGELTLEVPSYAMAGDVAVSGTGPPGATVHFLAKQEFMGISWLDVLKKDTPLGWVAVDADGTYESEISFDSFGSVEMYAKIKKGGYLDLIIPDVYSEKHTIFIMTWVVVIAFMLAIGLILEKKYNKLGLFKKKR